VKVVTSQTIAVAVTLADDDNEGYALATAQILCTEIGEPELSLMCYSRLSQTQWKALKECGDEAWREFQRRFGTEKPS
jgi:uncharacterized protein YehS (DUF1456 family)